MLAPELDQRVTRKTRHRGFTASNIAPQWLITPQVGIKQQVHQFGGAICCLADFFDDDLTLFFDISSSEIRVEHHVGQDINSTSLVDVGHFDRIDR